MSSEGGSRQRHGGVAKRDRDLLIWDRDALLPFSDQTELMSTVDLLHVGKYQARAQTHMQNNISLKRIQDDSIVEFVYL